MGTVRSVKRIGVIAKRMTGTSSRGDSEPLTDSSARWHFARYKDRGDERLVKRRIRSVVKRSARSILRAPRDQRKIVLIFGCQRSGTTMIQQVFLDQSWRVLILEEHDRRLVGDDPEETSWEDSATVLRRIRRLPFEIVAAKPLVESARATELMDAAGSTRAVWMLRHYGEVARSNLRRFGDENSHRDLQPFRSGDSLDWRCKGATEETRDTVTELLNTDLTPLDAAALFWWTRNRLYFDQHLWKDERIRILRYQRACTCPDDVVRSLSGHIGIPLPVSSIIHRVQPRGAVASVAGLNPEVERLCQKLWDSFAGCPEL